MSQQAMRQAARRLALDAQAVLRKERADRERRLQCLAVAVLTALAERDALVRDAERCVGQALRTMADDEGLSVREAVAWCGSGVAVREVPRLRQLARQAAAADERATVSAADRPRADGEQPGDSGGVSLEVGPGTGGTYGFADERMQLIGSHRRYGYSSGAGLRTGLGA